MIVKDQWLYDYKARVNSGSDIICDMLEGNESVDTDIDFELYATMANSYVLYCLEIKRTTHISATRS